MLSMQPAAVRQRRRRDKVRAAKEVRALPPGREVAARDSVTSSSGLHETSPITGPGPEAFAAPAFVPSSSENAKDAGTPIAGAPPPEPARQVTEAEASSVAMLVVAFYQMGVGELLAKRKSLTAKLSRMIDLQKTVGETSKLVWGSTTRLCVKYNVGAVADEGVVTLAMAFAVLGFAVKPEKDAHNENAVPVTREAAPPEAARDANAVEEPAKSPASGDMTPEKMAEMGLLS